ncbi:VOC family protein [Dactylosporangium sp. CA-233914]|uniref:VOC family protein n=1 Tax=Dactylosporangium sp. CA-233914 TaxID=3239934 RepID=UPI003D93CAF2
MNVALGPVHLTVADLTRSTDYYTRAIGMQILSHDNGRMSLGTPGHVLAVLQEERGAVAPPPSSPGLSHFAPQLPTRADLARFTQHYAPWQRELRLVDHTVAHSAYVTDPDGHQIEMTCHRPRDEWRWQDGRPEVVADPLDRDALLSEPGADKPYAGMPEGTTMGHVQLKVTDPGLTATRPFYCDVLGFTFVGALADMFLAVGFTNDNRAQLVLTNRFASENNTPAREGTARLLSTDFTHLDLGALAARLSAAGHPYELSAGTLHVNDPSGNLLRFIS